MHYITAKSVLTTRNELQIYKGCSNGCVYCDKKSKNPTGYAFSDIEVKENAIELLTEQIQRKNRCVISIGDTFDHYQDIERELMLVRKSLEIILKYKLGVAIKTKSKLVLRDLDLLEQIAKTEKATIILPISSYNDALSRILEPNASTSGDRFEIMKECKKRGINVVVELIPVIPFINDNRKNILSIVEASSRLGAYGIISNGMGFSLKDADKQAFYKLLERTFPDAFEKYHLLYKNKNEILSFEKYDLFNFFNAACINNYIENDVDKINDFIYSPVERQLSLFDFDL